METEKLYYIRPAITQFSARVLSCRKAEEGWELILDRTAFYPGGGGQPCDLGSIDGAGVGLVFEREGELIHMVSERFEPGRQVRGSIDAARRLDYTEQHTADHVLTGVIHRRWGYDNVGFHMGAETTTIDLNGLLSPEQLAKMEDEANAVVRADLPVLESFPTRDELDALEFRSKKELDGAVRIISIPGVDVCACCGTHLERTGGLGLIKVLSMTHLRGGIRLEIVAGARAWRVMAAVFRENHKNSVLLSARQETTSAAVERLLGEQERLRQELAATEKRWYAAQAKSCTDGEKALVFEQGLSPGQLQRLANELMERTGALAAVFSGSDGEGWSYAMGRRGGDLRDLTARMNYELSGRGGGRESFVQGKLSASRAEIEAFFDTV